ncbi:MAG TPA: hypothetical protein VEW67_09490 [Thermoleophilaceae bacterium]|nr:hypothetical protein [Thermoleophilaceae bacterium]
MASPEGAWLARALCCTACVTGAVALAACGGENDEADARKYVTAIERDSGDPAGLDDAGAIKEALSDLQGDFALERSTGVCLELSRGGRREIRDADAVDRCDYDVFELIKWNRARGLKPRVSTVFSVDVTGRRARARVGEPGRADYDVPFVKEGDSWKAVSLRDVEPVDGALESLTKTQREGLD